MDRSFRTFLDQFLEAWRNSSITQLQAFLSTDYQAREVTHSAIDDFGYEESIRGWVEGFQYVQENNATWHLEERAALPLNLKEIMVILSAKIIIAGEPLSSGNLFFETFQLTDENEWKLVRSYIEAGVPLGYLNKSFT